MPIELLMLIALGLVFWLMFLVRIASEGQFSFHQFYATRLVGAFLKASEASPLGNKTGSGDLLPSALSQRPFLTMNLAVNLPENYDAASEKGRIGLFTVTPLHAGSAGLGFRPIAEYAGGMSVGRAIATSGAAVSPSLAWSSFPLASLFMAVLNINLGAWMRNPGGRHWRRLAPPDLLMRLFREGAGRGSAKSRFVYLSDGGHFENLGLFAMVQRGCKRIVVIDNGHDPGLQFKDLGNAIRKIRLDLHVPIEIDVSAILQSGSRVKAHHLIGRIVYSAADSRQKDGVLILLKPSLSGDEPVEVLLHATSHPSFPQDPTSQQAYSEGQFESYRLLGRHLVHSISPGQWAELLYRDGSRSKDAPLRTAERLVD
jgi:hypothetical protein